MGGHNLELRMRVTGLLVVLFAAACSRGDSTAPGPVTEHRGDGAHDVVWTNGALRVESRDFPAQPGVMWIQPSIAPQPGAIVAEATHYGSLCRLELTGDAQVQENAVLLHIHYAERLTVCTAEIRAHHYTATLSVPRGTYDVTLVDEYGGSATVRATVTVP